MTELGLCCVFVEEPVKFRVVTARTLLALPPETRLARVSAVCLENAQSLLKALHTVDRLGIRAFRILSSLFPRHTHPEAGYTLDQLPDAEAIAETLRLVNVFRGERGIRLSLHPDQFVVLNAPNPEILRKSVAEIEYQALLARLSGAEMINLHGGGAYGDKRESLTRLADNFGLLSEDARSRLTLENDDVTHTPEDLLPFCRSLGVPLVYDVHHHRCNPDGLSVEEATRLAADTWTLRGQAQHLHISSPKNGWGGGDPKPHADYIDPADVPQAWRALDGVTLDVEAKAKERAVLKLRAEWPFANDRR